MKGKGQDLNSTAAAKVAGKLPGLTIASLRKDEDCRYAKASSRDPAPDKGSPLAGAVKYLGRGG